MGSMTKEINKISQIESIQFRTDFITIKFETAFLTFNNLVDIKEILEKYEYLKRPNYLAIIAWDAKYSVSISFCSKLYYNHFY